MSKILLVDDDDNILSLYKDRLEIDHHQVITAKDGKSALEVAEKEKPDLVISDIVMPKMTGMTLLKELRKTAWGAKLPVIMLTNFDTDNAILKGVIEDSPSYYLFKDQVTPDGVADKVKEALS